MHTSSSCLNLGASSLGVGSPAHRADLRTNAHHPGIAVKSSIHLQPSCSQTITQQPTGLLSFLSHIHSHRTYTYLGTQQAPARLCCPGPQATLGDSAFPSSGAQPSRHAQQRGGHGGEGGSAHTSHRCRGTPQLQDDVPILISVGQTPAEPPSSLAELLEAVEGGNSQVAYKAFRRLRQQTPGGALPGVTVCERLLHVMCEGRDFAACWAVYQAVKPAPLGRPCLRTLMDRAIKAQDMKGALEVFRDMQARGQRISIVVWCYMISSLNRVVKRKGWPYAEAAYELWEELQRQDFGPTSRPDAQYYAAGMMACIGVGRAAEAGQQLEAMSAAGFPPDVRAYNILLTGYARESDMRALERTFARIRQDGLAPDLTSYNIMVDAYTRANLPEKARAILVEAKGNGIKADVCTYTSIIKGAVSLGQLDEARSVLKDMEAAKVSPNVVTMSTLVDGYVRAERMEEAESLLKIMKQKRIRGNVILYNTLLRGYSKEGDMTAVRDVLQRMGEEGVHPREDTFNTLMEGALTADNPNMVPNLFKQLKGLRLRPDSLSYTSLITALSRLSRSEAAIEEAGKLEAVGGLDLISLNALVSVLANADRLVEAEETLQRAAALAEKKGLPPPVEAYGAILKAYTRKCDSVAALDLLAEFRQRGGEPDEWLASMTVTACVRAGEFRRALQFVRAMESEGKDIDKGRIKRALEAVLRLREQSYKRSFKELPRNDNLERFKFWLGLPNQYYDRNES